MKVSLAYADPTRQSVVELDLRDACTLGDALASAQLPADIRENLGLMTAGVWGKVRPMEHVLREGDRIELYRPLVADPKTARRKRAAAR